MANQNPTPRIENLRSWKAGESGNKAGYSKSRRLASALFDKLEKDGDIPEILIALVKGAKEGSIQHIREIFDRIDGKSLSAEPDAETVSAYDESESDDELDGTDSQRIRQIFEGGKSQPDMGTGSPSTNVSSPEKGT